MRKFLIGAVAVVCAIVGAWYAVYYAGFYVDLNPDAPVAVYSKTEGKRILVPNAQGVLEPFTVKGVELSGSLPGSYATDFAADKETYRRWMEQISEMGAPFGLRSLWTMIFITPFTRLTPRRSSRCIFYRAFAPASTQTTPRRTPIVRRFIKG